MMSRGSGVSINHAGSTRSKLGTRSVAGQAPGNSGGRIWVPSLDKVLLDAAACSGVEDPPKPEAALVLSWGPETNTVFLQAFPLP